jgi:TusA-related sulfurtransferase
MDDIDTKIMAGGTRSRAPAQPDERLDLLGVAFPFSLVLCKAALERLTAGKVLEIRLQDQEILRDLQVIVPRSGDQILAWEQQEDCYYLWVRRGTGCPEDLEG